MMKKEFKISTFFSVNRSMSFYDVICIKKI